MCEGWCYALTGLLSGPNFKIWIFFATCLNLALMEGRGSKIIVGDGSVVRNATVGVRQQSCVGGVDLADTVNGIDLRAS